jgi:hypothetical protein
MKIKLLSNINDGKQVIAEGTVVEAGDEQAAHFVAIGAAELADDSAPTANVEDDISQDVENQ